MPNARISQKCGRFSFTKVRINTFLLHKTAKSRILSHCPKHCNWHEIKNAGSWLAGIFVVLFMVAILPR